MFGYWFSNMCEITVKDAETIKLNLMTFAISLYLALEKLDKILGPEENEG